MQSAENGLDDLHEKRQRRSDDQVQRADQGLDGFPEERRRGDDDQMSGATTPELAHMSPKALHQARLWECYEILREEHMLLVNSTKRETWAGGGSAMDKQLGRLLVRMCLQFHEAKSRRELAIIWCALVLHQFVCFSFHASITEAVCVGSDLTDTEHGSRNLLVRGSLPMKPRARQLHGGHILWEARTISSQVRHGCW